MLQTNNNNLNIEIFERESKFPVVAYVQGDQSLFWQSKLSDFLIHYPTNCGKIYKPSTVSPEMDIRITYSGDPILNYDLIFGEVLDQVKLKLIKIELEHSAIKIMNVDESIMSSEHNKHGGGSHNLEDINLNNTKLSRLLLALITNSKEWYFDNIDLQLLKTKINLKAEIPKDASIFELSQILNKIGIKNKIIQRNYFYTIIEK